MEWADESNESQFKKTKSCRHLHYETIINYLIIYIIIKSTFFIVNMLYFLMYKSRYYVRYFYKSTPENTS